MSSKSQKLVVFDMDNTILTQRWIDIAAQQFNFTQALALLRHIHRDPVNLTVKIATLLTGKSTRDLLKIADDIPIVSDTYEVITELKRRNYKVGIISDSYQIITRHVGEKINADFWMANELQALNGIATGQVLIPSYFHYSEDSICKHQVCKTNALRHVAKKYEATLNNCIVVGDSENDVCMIRHAGLGVAFCTTNELLKKTADKEIKHKSFTDILKYA